MGRPEGYKFDTITFYDGEYFMGEQQNLYLDAASLQRDNLGRWVAIQFQIGNWYFSVQLKYLLT